MAERTALLEDFMQDGLIVEDDPEGAQLDLEASVNGWIADLGGKDGAWEHGFNSGMLACLRLVIGADEVGWTTALAEFPELST